MVGKLTEIHIFVGCHYDLRASIFKVQLKFYCQISKKKFYYEM